MNSDTWQFYIGKDGDWWWRRVARNGEEVGAATEGYTHKSNCIKNARRHGWDESQITEWPCDEK